MRMQDLDPFGSPEFLDKMNAFLEGGGQMNRLIPD